MRAREMISTLPPSQTSCLPKALRDRPRSTIKSSAFSAAPMLRMQWWMRPGPNRSCEISKPRPSPSSMLSLGTRTLLKLMCMWPCGAWSSPKTCMAPSMTTPGVSLGTRIIDCCWCGAASGLVRTIVMRILQRGLPAPEM